MGGLIEREGGLLQNLTAKGRGLLQRGFNREGGLIELLWYV